SGLYADRIERSAKGEECEIKLLFHYENGSSHAGPRSRCVGLACLRHHSSRRHRLPSPSRFGTANLAYSSEASAFSASLAFDSPMFVTRTIAKSRFGSSQI